MSRFKSKAKNRSYRCLSCGMHYNEWVYIYSCGSACLRTYGTRKGRWAFDRQASKPCNTLRAEKVDGKWVKHRKSPGWKRDRTRVTPCCDSPRFAEEDE